MTFWTTQFHKSDADNDLLQTIDRINDAAVRLRVVLGNDDTENTVLHDLKILKKDRALARFGWLSERRTPRADEGKVIDFYVDSSFMKIYKKMNKGWTEFGTLRGQTGPQGVRGESLDPFHMITDIVRYAKYYVYIHPSRFDLIEKTGKHSYRGRTIHDFFGKSLTTPPLDISRDENDRYYATIGPDKTISVRVHFNSRTWTKRSQFFKCLRWMLIRRPMCCLMSWTSLLLNWWIVAVCLYESHHHHLVY